MYVPWEAKLTKWKVSEPKQKTLNLTGQVLFGDWCYHFEQQYSCCVAFSVALKRLNWPKEVFGLFTWSFTQQEASMIFFFMALAPRHLQLARQNYIEETAFSVYLKLLLPRFGAGECILNLQQLFSSVTSVKIYADKRNYHWPSCTSCSWTMGGLYIFTTVANALVICGVWVIAP